MVEFRRWIFYIFTLLLILVGQYVLAGERFELYEGARSLGMGGARVAVVNDETALLVNPAGLGKLREKILTVIDPEVDFGYELQGLVGYSYLAFLDPQTILNLLNLQKTRYLHQKMQIFPSMVFPNFGMGLYGKWSTDAEVDAAGTNFSLDYVNDYVAVIGYNFRLFDGRIKLGFNGRMINRTEIHKTDIPANSTTLTVGNQASEGVGIGSDVGLIITLPWAWLPTLAAVYRDVGNTDYSFQSGMFLNTATRPAMSNATLDVGFAIFPLIGKTTRFVFTGEYRDALATAEQEPDTMKRIHAGMEFNFSDVFFLRAGYHQRYWTAGFEFNLLNYQMQLATYGEEIGTVTTPREDRRYVGKFSFRF